MGGSDHLFSVPGQRLSLLDVSLQCVQSLSLLYISSRFLYVGASCVLYSGVELSGRSVLKREKKNETG